MPEQHSRKTIADMLHIIANQFTLTSFLLDSLPPERQGNIHLHPKRIKGLAYSLLKAIDALLPFKLPGFKPFPQAYLQGLSEIPEDASVLIFGTENIKDLKIIRKYLRTRRVSVFTWNPVIDFSQNHRARRMHIRLLKGLGFKIFTFDPADAEKYELTLVNQVYRQVDEYIEPVAAEFDVYFLGKNKGRFDTLEALGVQLQTKGLRPHFLMMAESKTDYPEKTVVTICRQELDYSKNIDLINRSRCLLELTQANQTGLTIRCLEAMFFGKKLITSNPLVRQLPFYDPDLFFILGQDDLSRIGDFVKSEVPRIAESDLIGYEFSNWIKQFDA